MLINFMWPRGGSNPPLSALPNLGLTGAIGGIPIFEATVLVILIVGAIYWAFAQRRMPETAAIAPAEAPA